MIQETIVVKENTSTHAELGGIIVSAVATYSGHARIVVGRPGLPNVDSDLTVGGAVLFETPEGLFEAGLMSANSSQVTVLLSQSSPRLGIAGGFVDQDSENAPFTQPELIKIAASVEQSSG